MYAAWPVSVRKRTLTFSKGPRLAYVSAQVAEALQLLPTVGYVRVLKTSDGEQRSYTAADNDTSDTFQLANGSTGAYFLWQWDVEFVGNGGDIPLMAAVWADGRALRQDGYNGQASRRTCTTCRSFPRDAWSTNVVTPLGDIVEV